jgi:formate hydrogenlyase transcriptional activator
MMATASDNRGTALSPRTASTHQAPSQRRQVPDGIVGQGPRLTEIIERIERVSATDATVLITGETGTGKELVARAIHRRSRRSSNAMVSANLAALPQDLVASELFGHEAGAFTGANQRRIGRFEASHGSTLFLDEVAELPPATQVALLRALQEGQFERVGGTQTRTADVRVIGATNRSLEQAVKDRTFRRDLYYRLAVFPIRLPPLRERRDDIPALVAHFLILAGDRVGRTFEGLDEESMNRLVEYSWPGNIRELQNVIEHSAILSDGGLLHVPPVLLSNVLPASSAGLCPNLNRALESNERRMIEKALKECNGRVFGPDGAATRLGIPSSTLESKIKRYGINKHSYRSSI